MVGGFSCCGKKIKNDPTDHLKSLGFFWEKLTYLEAREGFMEIHHEAEYNETQLKRDLKHILD